MPATTNHPRVKPGGQPLEPARHELDEHDGDPEGGQRLPEHRDDLGGAIEGRALLHRGEHAQGEGHGERHAHGEDGQAQGVGQALADQLAHGPPSAERHTKIAGDSSPHEGQVLLDVGAVEAEIAPGFRVVLWRGRHGEDEVEGIAGGPCQDEHYHGQDGEGHQRLQEP